MKIAIIKENKVPSDARVPLTPAQCQYLIQEKGLDIVVQRSDIRCYKDDEYAALGVPMVDDVNDRDILLGVKEVPIDKLIENKTYFFFSHTIKEQPYNRNLLKAVIDNKIRLIDYEALTAARGGRLIAFGFFAGMVGAYNGMMGYGIQQKKFALARLNTFFDYKEAAEQFHSLELPAMKVVLTGDGRVSKGAKKVLLDMGLEQVSNEKFLSENTSKAVFTQVLPSEYVKRKDGSPFEKKTFFSEPKRFESNFLKYCNTANVLINGVYWDNEAPAFFTLEDAKSENFKVSMIADITCDIAPVASIPTTIKASTIADPFFGYDTQGEKEIAAFSGGLDMMTIDNLPSELPRDASASFGEQFVENILPGLLNEKDIDILERASITTKEGTLGKYFTYLTNYLQG